MSGHVVETTCELSAFMKAGVMAGSERDAGFCSGGDEDDMSGLHSPSASEDSVEVQVIPISLRNKRKLAEPRKIQEQSTAPLKKRRFEQIIEETVVVNDEERRTVRSPSPFRPWSTSNKSNAESKSSAGSATAASAAATTAIGSPSTATAAATVATSSASINAAVTTTVTSLANKEDKEDEEEEEEDEEEEEEEDDEEERRRRRRRQEEEARRRHEARIQEEVLLRLRESKHRPESPTRNGSYAKGVQRREPRQRFEPPPPTAPMVLPQTKLQEEPLALVLRGEIPRVPSHPAVSGSYERNSSYPMEQHVSPHPGQHQTTPPSASHHHHQHQHHHHQAQNHQQSHHQSHQSHQSHQNHQQPNGSHQSRHHQGGQQRNYKNMTRERRIEANARERTRVHTISAAFDTLRRAIPAYSHNQKLSKLSVLRIACSYIMTLSKIANTQDGELSGASSLAACVDLVSRTIQTEGKLRKRKDD